MKKTSEGLVAWAIAAHEAGWVYWYGTCGYQCTKSLLNSKTNQYPSHYRSSRRPTYEKHIEEGRVAADCIGLMKSYAWDKDGDIDTVGGKYGSNEHPDKSTKQALADCTVKGDISTIPEIPGLTVWTKEATHIAVYIGGGEVIELKGFSDDCQRNRLANRTFTTWGLYPYVDYTPEQIALAKAAAGMVQGIAKGDRGEAVEEIQTLLMAAGYDLGKYGVDGKFGSETLSAVRAFQHDVGLAPNGIVDDKTLDALRNHKKPMTFEERLARLEAAVFGQGGGESNG